MVGRERIFRLSRYLASPHCTSLPYVNILARSTFSRAAPSPSSRESTRWRLLHPLTLCHTPPLTMLHLPPYHAAPPYQVATLSGGDCFGEIA